MAGTVMDRLIDILFDLQLLQFWYSAASFLLIISVIVFVHELGHYSVAKLSGVRIEVFSLGFGKEILGWNDRSGTRWKVCLLPLGGYVKMFGDANPASKPDAKVAELSAEQKKYTFYHKPLFVKTLIAAAGPAANFVLAIVLLAFFFNVYGQRIILPIADEIMKGSRAEMVGIKPGDRVLSVNGTSVSSFAQLQRIVSLYAEMPISLKLQRGNTELSVKVNPKLMVTKDAFGNESKIGLLGIASRTAGEAKRLPLPSAIKAAVVETYDISSSVLLAVKQILVGERSLKELGGPIKIAKYSGQSVSMGTKATLWYIVFLSINLGLFNLFPIPVLDGGHIFVYAIEAIIRRPVSAKILGYWMNAGLLFILGLMVFVIFNDLTTMF